MAIFVKIKTKFNSEPTSFLLFAIWLSWSLLMLVFATKNIGELITDPDDFMRMAQVRDWLSGQSWFDVTQYRIYPPEGASMHWSRLLDVPIGGILHLGGLLLPPQTADLVAIIAMPVSLFGLLMLLVFGTVKRLADEKIALLAAFLIPTYPLIFRQFLPGRIDHHSWQILMAALALFAFFKGNSKYSAYLMGGAIAFWMHISIEGLPYAIIFGAVLGAFYIFPQLSDSVKEDNRLVHYLNSLTFFSLALILLTQTRANLLIPYCDAVSWPLLACLIAVSVGMSIVHRIVRKRQIWILIGAMLLVGLVGIYVFLAYSESCALNPFGQLSPLVQSFWHESISEGLAIDRQAAPIVLLLIFVPLIFFGWMIYLICNNPVGFEKKQWLSLAFLVVCTSILSFKIQRTAGVAELFALPGLAALTAVIVYKIQLLGIMYFRVIATVAVVVSLTPMASFVAGDALSVNSVKREALQVRPDNKRACSLDELRSLEPGLIFTTMAAGPEILYRTRHSVYASGYHRNHIIMHQLIATMLGPTENAYKMLSDASVRYVVFCPTHFEAQSYLRASKKGFVARLMTDELPAWLKPVPAFANSEMRVYRFQKLSNN